MMKTFLKICDDLLDWALISNHEMCDLIFKKLSNHILPTSFKKGH